jgi:hypothetical protein
MGRGTNQSQSPSIGAGLAVRTETRPPLEDRLAVVRRGLARPHARLADQCPGDHQYVQHRDGKPPWCDACGFRDIGLHRREYGTGKPTDDGEED